MLSLGMFKQRKDNHLMAAIEGDRGRRGEDEDLSSGVFSLGDKGKDVGPVLGSTQTSGGKM